MGVVCVEMGMGRMGMGIKIESCWLGVAVGIS